MKAFAKVFVILTGLALIGMSVLALFLFTQFDTFGKGALERTLTFALNAPTTIDAITFAPAKGLVELRGLTVSNPKGFKEIPAMTFGKVSIEFDYQTLFSKTPTIRKILLQNGKIDLRYDLGAGSNLAHIAKYAARFSKDKFIFGNGVKDKDAAAGKDKADSAAKDKPDPSDSPVENLSGAFPHRKFVVQEFRCEGTTITVGSNLLPTMAATMELPPFSLSGLGKDKPVTAGEVTALFLRSLTHQALSGKNLLGPAADTLRQEFTPTPEPPTESPTEK